MSTPQEDAIALEVDIEDEADSSKTYIKYDRDIIKKILFGLNLVVFLVALGICVASFTIPSLRNATPSGIAMWQWSLLATALLCGPLLSKILHYMVIFIDTKFGVAAARENAIYYVVDLIESAWVVLWFSIILVAWLWVVDEPSYLGIQENQNENEKIRKKFAKTFHIITITLITIIIGSFIWLLKDVLLLKAKSSFHIDKFFDRVTDALGHQEVVNMLTPELNANNVGKSNWCQRMCDWKEKMPRLNPSQVNQKNVTSWGMQKVINWLLENEKLTYKLEGEDKKIIDKDITSVDDAIEAATKIYPIYKERKNEINKYIKKRVDVQRPRDQVSTIMYSLVDKQEVSEDDIKDLMVKAFKYRTTLAQLLKANKRLFKALNRFMDALLVFFIFALWLMMLRVETRKVIVFIATAIVGSFIVIGDTCKKLLDCLLFIFVVHPFDIGDCCLIDDTLVTIKKIYILTTHAVTLDNEIRYYPNTELASKCISNFTRSREMGDSVEFSVPIGTAISDIEEDIKCYITGNPKYWRKEYHLVKELKESDDNKVKMRLHFNHTINPHDVEERQNRKSELVVKISEILQKGTNLKSR